MFYNVTPFSHEIENIFIHKGLTSFFIEPYKIHFLFSTHQLDLSIINSGVPVPRTILKGTNKRELLEKYVNHLSGFPLILKATGGTLGLGVIKVESWENLISIADLLVAQKIHFQLKEYIKNKGTIRAIVLGDRVICSMIRINPPDDFRCSSPDRNSIQKAYPIIGTVEGIAVKATKAVNFEFTGVDLVEGEDGRFYVLEINYPNDFTIPANFSGIDVAGKMVKHLYEKSQR